MELVGRSPRNAYITAGVAAGGVLAAALNLVPGAPLVCAGLAYLAYERVSAGRQQARARDLLLVIGEVEVWLPIADGVAAAKRIVDELAPYTRQAPITRPEVYEDAKRRLQAQVEGRPNLARRELEGGLVLGADAVEVDGEFLVVGGKDGKSFRIDEVRKYARDSLNLPLPGGRLLQAALALIVVEAEHRARQGEDLEALNARIAAYEAWTGRTAGR